MKRGSKPHGYTLVEILIVLAITSTMFVMATFLISGRQANAEFSQSVRDMEAALRDVVNDVGSGFYPNNGTFSCTTTGMGGSLTFPGGAGSQGTRDQCVTLGKVVQFGPGGGQTMRVHTIAGRRRTPSGLEVSKLSEAQPAIVFGPTFNVSQEKFLQFGLRVTRVFYGAGTDVAAVGVLATLGQYGSTGDLVSGAQSNDLVVVPGSNLGQDTAALDGPVRNLHNRTDAEIASFTNPSGGVTICLRGGNDKRAAIIIGAANHKLTTETQIDQAPGACP